MSKLQDFVNKLVDVVIIYRKDHTPVLNEAETKNIPASDLTAILHRWICNMDYPVRKPLMRFFIYAIDQVKPLVDKPEPLSEQEQQTIQTILVHLLTTNVALLRHYQSAQPFSITYGDTTEAMPGFIKRGITGFTYYCDSGQIIQNTLFKSKDLAELTETSNFQDIINRLINNHQQPLLKMVEMEQKINSLTGNLEETREDREQKRIEIEQHLTNNQLIASDLETQKNKSRLLEEENTTLRASLLVTEKTIAELQQCIAELQQCNHGLNQQIAMLKTTESDGIPLSSSLIQGEILKKSKPSMAYFSSSPLFWPSSCLLKAAHSVEINGNHEDTTTKKTS